MSSPTSGACSVARARCRRRQPNIAVDANQRWGVGEAIEWMGKLADVRPVLDRGADFSRRCAGSPAIRNAVRPIRVATGEHVQNRVIFKQMLQAEAIDVVQIDACRVGGVNENLAIILLAAKFGVPVCPHAGGVGLCEMVQHLAMFDFVAVSGTSENRWIEYVDHLHEHFTEPVVVRDGRYRAPNGARRRRANARRVDRRVPISRWPGVDCAQLVTTRIDAHHHVWDLAVRDQPWMTGDAMAPIARKLRRSTSSLTEADANGIAASVVVQTVARGRRDRRAARPRRRHPTIGRRGRVGRSRRGRRR